MEVIEQTELILKTESIETPETESVEINQESSDSCSNKCTLNSTTTTPPFETVNCYYRSDDKNASITGLNISELVKQELYVVNDGVVSTSSDYATKEVHKPFQCALCNYSARRRHHLDRHQLLHTGIKPYKCTFCDYSAKQSGSLKIHIRTHTGEKPYPCLTCAYCAKDRSTLQEHMKLHSGAKPFKCTACDYSASRKHHLQRHIRTHTGEKPFKCPFCEYNATRNEHLQRHVRTHTGEKPYKCLVCEYSAARLEHLRRHLKSHANKIALKFASEGLTLTNEVEIVIPNSIDVSKPNPVINNLMVPSATIESCIQVD